MESTSLIVSEENQQALFDRGFKTWCQNTSASIRKRLGQNSASPLSPYVLSETLGVIIWRLDEVPELKEETFQYLTSDEGNEWSAVTVVVNDKEFIVVNPTHSAARQASDLMHELAHIIKDHNAGQVFMSDAGYALRNFDEKQEAEADWLAGSLLLPREALVSCHFRRYSLQQACQIFGVSESLFTYRMNMSGVRNFRRKY